LLRHDGVALDGIAWVGNSEHPLALYGANAMSRVDTTYVADLELAVPQVVVVLVSSNNTASCFTSISYVKASCHEEYQQAGPPLATSLRSCEGEQTVPVKKT